MSKCKAIFAFLTLASLSPVAAEATRYETTFLVLAESGEAGEATQLQGLVGDFTVAALESEGFPISELPEEISVASAYGDEEPRELLLEYLSDLGDSAGADFVIHCLVEETPRGTALKFRLVSTDGAELVATADERVAQLLLLDFAIVASVQKMLDASRDRFVLSPVVESAEEPEEVAVALPPPVLKMIEQERPSRFLLSAGVGILQVFGENSELFSEGLTSALRASYAVPIRIGAVTFGLSTGVGTIEASGVDGPVTNLIAPVGPQLGISAWPSGFLEVDLLLSGGVAFLGVDIDQTGYLFKVVPQALASVGISLFPGAHIGLGIAVSVVAYFEETFPIFGYAPSAGIVIR